MKMTKNAGHASKRLIQFF